MDITLRFAGSDPGLAQALLTTCLGGAIGFIGAVLGAILGGRHVERLQRNNSLKVTRVALATEIRGLRKALLANLARPMATPDYVRFFAGGEPARFCPIYVGAANDIGVLDRPALESIVTFYTELLTAETTPIKARDGDVDHRISLTTLRRLEGHAEQALQSLEEI